MIHHRERADHQQHDYPPQYGQAFVALWFSVKWIAVIGLLVLITYSL